MDRDRRPIYLDHLASTPVDPDVRAAMLPWLAAEAAGNPHSEHDAGWRAAAAVDDARAGIARLIGAERSEIVFTSGATEANNIALFGLAGDVERIIVSAIEHPSILEPAEVMRGRGLAVTVLPVGKDGQVDLSALAGKLAGGRALVSIMAANNEIGTVQPLAEIGELCRAHGATFHTDAAQALSTQTLDVDALAIDLLSLSGHKLYGPAGIGALYVRHGVLCRPMTYGGGQQGGLRPGTVPVALCAGLGAACGQALARRDDDAKRIAALRDHLYAALRAACPSLQRNSPENGCVPGCLNVSVPGLDAADFLLDLPGLAISTGAACSALSGRPSHVLRAIGLTAEQAHGSLRFGLGRGTTAEEVETAAARISAALRDRGCSG
jgi:cysteine desulfurase